VIIQRPPMSKPHQYQAMRVENIINQLIYLFFRFCSYWFEAWGNFDVAMSQYPRDEEESPTSQGASPMWKRGKNHIAKRKVPHDNEANPKCRRGKSHISKKEVPRDNDISPTCRRSKSHMSKRQIPRDKEASST